MGTFCFKTAVSCPRWLIKALCRKGAFDIAAKMAQNGAQMVARLAETLPRRPKITPRWPKTAPRCAQKSKKYFQDAPKMAQDGLKQPKIAPSGSTKGPKMTQK